MADQELPAPANEPRGPAQNVNPKPSRWAGLAQALATIPGAWASYFKERGWEWWLGFALALGIVFLLLYSAGHKNSVQTAGVCLLIAGAASACGVMVGFLFGVPRTPPRDSNRSAGGQAADPSAGINTNLTEISDWLTKIIVGVGLVQLGSIPGRLMSMGDYLGQAFGAEEPVSSSVVNLIAAYFAIFSFLVGYLWTRIYLSGEFSKAEREARERPEYLEGIVHALLYQPKPGGYTEAIKKAKEYQERYGESNERIWTYLACAYGNQYAYLDGGAKKDKAKLDETKKQALHAATKASENRAAWEMLFSLWHPDLAKADEDDLTPFFNDPGFRELFKPLLKEHEEQEKKK